MLGVRSQYTMLGAGMGVKANGAMITLEDGLSATRTNFKDPDHVATYVNRGRGGSGPTVSGNEKFDDYDIDGAGFTVNPVMTKLYKDYNATLPESDRFTNNESVPDPTKGFDPLEASLEQLKNLNPDYQSSFAQYGDAAIVVIGRPSSETYDFWKGEMNKETTGVEEPLQLSDQENEIINLACEKFNKVVVLLNAAAPMDIDHLQNNPKIGAIVNIGQPGTYGLLGVAQVLAGKVSPSGHLVDTYAANQLSAPAMMNMGDYTFANEQELTRSTIIGGPNTSKKYIIEAEGIYTGYKYYETRYADCVMNQGNANGSAGVYASKNNSWNYDDEVTYSFGYGLSYTTFKQEYVGNPVFDQTAHEITMTVKVKVTNTGDVAGKDVVQVYGSAPYSVGGIEKSAIQLLGFGKTDEIQPGKSETIEVTVDLQNLASYDMNHANANGTKGTYVFDAGDYYFAIGNGAHDALNNVLTAQGYNVGGDKSKAFKKFYDYDDQTFSVSKNGEYISNQLEYGDWNYYGGEKVTYLSRSDWQGTYPKEYSNMTASAKLVADLNGVGDNYYHLQDATVDENGKSVEWGKASDVKLAQMYKAAWDDTRWETILDTVSLEEAVLSVMYGGPNLAGAPSVGWEAGLYLTENSGSGVDWTFAKNTDPDAPWAIKEDDNNYTWNGGVFANAPTTAASWNAELWYELGEFIGTEGLFTGITFLWGPGLNTHRHSYNGRTGEYYSEDGVLCGVIAMEYAYGALKKGMIASPKHYAFNDQETNRAGVAPFMTEQRARETELRAYQIAVESAKYDVLTGEDCGMRGLMTSFSKIGGVEVCASYGMMTAILQKEWGFHGYAVTDIYDDTDLFVPVAASGTVCFDLRGQNPSTGIGQFFFMNQAQGYKHAVETYQKDAVLQGRLKAAEKNMLWVAAQSSLMNRFNENSYAEWQMTSWRAAYIFGAIAFGVLTAASAAMYVISLVKKEEN